MKKLLFGVLFVAVLVLVFGVLIPSFASYEEIIESMAALSPVQWLFLIAVFLVGEILTAAPPATMVERMSIKQSLMANESAAVVSNVVPGPSGLVARLAVYQAYGLDIVDITNASVVNSVLNQIVTLLLPFGALLIIVAQGSVSPIVWALIGIAAVILVVVVASGWLLLRSESSARWFGERTGALFKRLDGLRGVTSDRNWSDAAADAREQLIDGLRLHGTTVLALHLAKHATSIVLLLLALRFSGVTAEQLGLADVYIVYAFTLVATLIPVTPGGVGVAEATLIAIGSAIAVGASTADVTAGVLIYRLFVYIGPIILGVGCIAARKRLMASDDGGSATI